MSWRGKLSKYLSEDAVFPDEKIKEDRWFTPREPGFTHPDNKSTVKIRDNGNIDIFAGEELGIRISPNNNSITMLCDKLNLMTSQTLLHTDDDSFIWNYWPFNPYIYQMMPWDLQVDASYRYWDSYDAVWRRTSTSFPPVLRHQERWSQRNARYINDEKGIIQDAFKDIIEEYDIPEIDIDVHYTGDPENPRPGEGIEWE